MIPLAYVLSQRDRDRALQVYQSELLWLIATSLGGGDIPRVDTILREDKGQQDDSSAEDIITRLQRKLERLSSEDDMTQ